MKLIVALRSRPAETFRRGAGQVRRHVFGDIVLGGDRVPVIVPAAGRDEPEQIRLVPLGEDALRRGRRQCAHHHRRCTRRGTSRRRSRHTPCSHRDARTPQRRTPAVDGAPIPMHPFGQAGTHSCARLAPLEIDLDPPVAVAAYLLVMLLRCSRAASTPATLATSTARCDSVGAPLPRSNTPPHSRTMSLPGYPRRSTNGGHLWNPPLRRPSQRRELCLYSYSA